MALVKRDISGKYENVCASFCMAASIGNYTIDALDTIEKITKMPESSDAEKLAKVEKVLKMCVLIKSNILVSVTHCTDDVNNPEDEILYGTAGYLQTLLLLRKEFVKTHSIIEVMEGN